MNNKQVGYKAKLDYCSLRIYNENIQNKYEIIRQQIYWISNNLISNILKIMCNFGFAIKMPKK
jgi:hypothetical protein